MSDQVQMNELTCEKSCVHLKEHEDGEDCLDLNSKLYFSLNSISTNSTCLNAPLGVEGDVHILWFLSMLPFLHKLDEPRHKTNIRHNEVNYCYFETWILRWRLSKVFNLNWSLFFMSMNQLFFFLLKITKGIEEILYWKWPPPLILIELILLPPPLPSWSSHLFYGGFSQPAFKPEEEEG